MKNNFLNFLMICVVFISLKGYSQTNLSVNSIKIKKTSLILMQDSIGNNIYRTDSLDILVFINFSHLVNDVKEIYIQYGDTTNSSTVLLQNLNVLYANNKYYLNGLVVTQGINYGTNLVYNFRILNNSNLKWATVQYKNNLNVISNKTFYKIK